MLHEQRAESTLMRVQNKFEMCEMKMHSQIQLFKDLEQKTRSLQQGQQVLEGRVERLVLDCERQDLNSLLTSFNGTAQKLDLLQAEVEGKFDKLDVLG